jgi:hypothetical protein
MRRMSEHVKLENIMKFFEDIGQPIKYNEFKQTFEGKVKTEKDHENILQVITKVFKVSSLTKL